AAGLDGWNRLEAAWEIRFFAQSCAQLKSCSECVAQRSASGADKIGYSSAPSYETASCHHSGAMRQHRTRNPEVFGRPCAPDVEVPRCATAHLRFARCASAPERRSKHSLAPYEDSSCPRRRASSTLRPIRISSMPLEYWGTRWSLSSDCAYAPIRWRVMTA